MADWEPSKPTIGWTTPSSPPPLTPPGGGGPGGTLAQRVQNPTWASMAIALVLAMLIGFVGVGVVLSRHNASNDAISTNPFGTSPATTPTTVGGTSPAQQAPVDPQTIASQVTPSIVDVTTSLGYGTGEAAGTGMIISATGDVLTNYHVIDGATSINVQINGSGPTYTATIVGTDRTDDVALLQMSNPPSLTPVQIGKSADVQVGDRVVAIGNALGRGGPLSVVSGVVAATNQTATASDPASGSSETLSGLIQTTVPLQPGDSGGPLVDASGQVIGMNTAALVQGRFGGGSSTGVAFAIPIAHAISIASDIKAGKAGGNIQVGQPGYIGVQVRADGTVSRVIPGLPADSAGVLAGDTITAVDGTSIDSATSLTAALGTHRAGDTVNVSWLDQSGQHHTAKMQLVAGNG